MQFYKQHYDEATSMVNKEIWAVKFPMLEFTRVARIADLISDLKCIYIYRNVFDVIRSQKSKGWISTRQNVIESCLEWVKNTDVVAALKKNDFQNQPAMLHVVQYEDLVLNLDSNLKAIEAFTGLRGIRPEVADTKVNTWITASKEDMAPAVSYREPEPLSPEDVETIRTICASRMDELYPDFEAAPA